MKKTKVVIYSILALIFLGLPICFITLYAKGYEIIPYKELKEDNTYYETDNYIFDYLNIMVDEEENETNTISNVFVYKKFIFFYKEKEVTYYSGFNNKDEELKLISIKDNEKYHNFLFPKLKINEEGLLSFSFSPILDSFKIDSKDYEIERNCYFISDERIVELEINGDIYNISYSK